MRMTGIFKKAFEAYENQKAFGEAIRKERLIKDAKINDEHKKNLKEFGQNLRNSEVEEYPVQKHIHDIARAVEGYKDPRYNEPKGKHKASEEQIDEAIENTEIYKRAKELILKAQRGQIGYGIDKYPETLNANTWTMIETMHHIIDESVDKLHYEVMLLIKLERDAEKQLEEFKAKETLYADELSEPLRNGIKDIAELNEKNKNTQYEPRDNSYNPTHWKGKSVMTPGKNKSVNDIDDLSKLPESYSIGHDPSDPRKITFKINVSADDGIDEIQDKLNQALENLKLRGAY